MAVRTGKAILGFGLALLGLPAARATNVDIGALFDRAEAAGRVGVARKTKLVDGRSADPGEVIVTVIKGEGKETQSPPAEAGDVVIRNRCPATGNEQYLVQAARLPSRYDGPLAAPDAAGWQPYRPKGIDMRFFVVEETEGTFTFTAPWGEEMIARPGDAIVRNPADPEDTYRVAATAFECTYEVVAPPARR
jgi:quercetin dioxygenase-like cupin family protein